MRAAQGLCLVLAIASAGDRPLVGLARAAADQTGGIERCRRETDKQAIIAACSDVIAASKDPRTLERAYNRRGLANERSGLFGAAVNDFSAVIALNPKIAGYFDNRMRAYKGLGQLDLALQDSETAVRMAPNYPFALHGRGSVFFDQGRYDMAIRDFSAALGINAADAPLLVDRGRALMKTGQIEKAMADFTAAQAVDPGFAPALRERGLAHMALGHTDQARSDLTAALTARPADELTAAALRDLNGGGATEPAKLIQTAASTVADPLPAADPPALTPTQQAEAEAERKLKAAKDAEQARLNAAARLKAERLTRATTAAKLALKDASDFVKTNRDTPQLVEHLEHITDLTTALAVPEPGPIEQNTALLTAGLAADPIYVVYEAQHAAGRQHDAALALADALQVLKGQKAFLITVVVQDSTSAQAPAFLSLAREVDAVAAAPDLDRAQTLVGTIDTAIDKAGLKASYAAAQQAQGDAASKAEAAKAPAR